MRRMQLKALLAAALVALVAASVGGAVDGSEATTAQGNTETVMPPIEYESEPDPANRTIVDPKSKVEPSEARTIAAGVTDVSYAGQSSAGCRTKVAWIGAKNAIGTYLWKYFQKLGWCWRNGGVTSATPRCRGTWAEVYFPLWDFKGHIGCDSSGGVGQSFVRRWRQGKFQLCAAYCFQTKTPWLNVRGSGTGGFTYGYGM